MANEREAPILERGGRGDDLLGDRAPFPQVAVDHRLRDGEVVELGGMRLIAHLTAGHTRGCTSWAFEIEDGDKTPAQLSRVFYAVAKTPAQRSRVFYAVAKTPAQVSGVFYGVAKDGREPPRSSAVGNIRCLAVVRRRA